MGQVTPVLAKALVNGQPRFKFPLSVANWALAVLLSRASVDIVQSLDDFTWIFFQYGGVHLKTRMLRWRQTPVSGVLFSVLYLPGYTLQSRTGIPIRTHWVMNPMDSENLLYRRACQALLSWSVAFYYGTIPSTAEAHLSAMFFEISTRRWV